MKIVKRMVVGLIAAGVSASAVVAGGSPAQAATRVFPADGGVCVGTQVLRCLELRYDDVNERYRARAEVTDVGGGPDYVVDVVEVWLHGWRYPGNGMGDTVKDSAQTELFDCTYQGEFRLAPFEATLRWRNAATGNVDEETRYGLVAFTCT